MQQQFIEIGIDAPDPLPGIDLAANAYHVRIDVLLGHKKRWKGLLTLPVQGEQITTRLYGAYSNDGVRS